VTSQLLEGRLAHVVMNTYPNKVVIKITLRHERSHEARNGFAIAWVECVARGLPSAIVVDRGHANSKGEALVTIVMRPQPLVAGMVPSAAPAHDAVLEDNCEDAVVSDQPPPKRSRSSTAASQELLEPQAHAQLVPPVGGVAASACAALPPLHLLPDRYLEGAMQDAAKYVRGAFHSKVAHWLGSPEVAVQHHQELVSMARDMVIAAFSSMAGKKCSGVDDDGRVGPLADSCAENVVKFWTQDLVQVQAPVAADVDAGFGDGSGTAAAAPVSHGGNGPPGGLQRNPGFGLGPRRSRKKR